jgi:hypothetical protein
VAPSAATPTKASFIRTPIKKSLLQLEEQGTKPTIATLTNHQGPIRKGGMLLQVHQICRMMPSMLQSSLCFLANNC